MAKKQRKRGQHKVVEVRWVDATGHSGWMPRNIAAKKRPIVMQTVGYELERTKDYLKIVRTVEIDDDTNDIGDLFIIPRSWVISIKRAQ